MKISLNYLLIISILISQNPITAFSFSSINTKHIKDALAITSGILAVPCFKKCHNLSIEYDSLLKSVLPNFEELFENECNQQSFFTHSSTYTHLWNKFLKTNVEPTHPEVMLKLDTLNIKAELFLLAGILLTSAALVCVIDNYASKNSNDHPSH